MRNFITKKFSEISNFLMKKISHIKTNKKFAGRNARNAAIIVVFAAFIAVLFAGLIIFSPGKIIKPKQEVSKSEAYSENPIVYKKDDGIYFTNKSKTIKLDITDDYNLTITDDGAYLIYTKPSAKISKKYDLLVCDLSKKSKMKKGPTIKDFGVEREFKYNDGILYYSKQKPEDDSIMTYMYDIKKNKKEELDTAVDKLFIPSNGETIYYTKTLENLKAIYSYYNGEKKELAKKVKAINFYDNGQTTEIFYETDNADGKTSDITKISNSGEIVRIAIKVVKALYEDYQIGENFYFYTQKDVPSDWRGIIEDDCAELDAAMKEPSKKDFYYFLVGKHKYESKKKRDKIREYLDEKVRKDLLKDSYDLYVKRGSEKTATRIAEGVLPENVYAVSRKGAPRVIYKAVHIKNSGRKISNINIAEVDEILKENIVETGLMYAYIGLSPILIGDGEYNNVSLENYDPETLAFSFGAMDNVLFVREENKKTGVLSLYKHYVTKDEIGPAEEISSSVKKVKFVDETIWFTDSQRNELWKSSEKEPIRIDENVYSFTVYSDSKVLIYKDYNDAGGEKLVSLSYYDGEETTEISKSVDFEQISSTKDGVIFLRKTSDSTNELCSYSKGKLHVIEKNVDSVIAY